MQNCRRTELKFEQKQRCCITKRACITKKLSVKYTSKHLGNTIPSGFQMEFEKSDISN